MLNIIPLLACLSQELSTTTLRQLGVIVEAMLCMNGRITMLGISRWTSKGGSYRTIQRFYPLHRELGCPLSEVEISTIGKLGDVDGILVCLQCPLLEVPLYTV